MPHRNRTWTDQPYQPSCRRTVTRRPSRPGASLSPPTAPGLFQLLGILMLVLFCLFAFVVLYTVSVLDWRFTAKGFALVAAFGVTGVVVLWGEL